MLSGGSHGETHEILASLSGQAGLMLSSTQDVCYPNKKEVYSCQHNAIWLFQKPGYLEEDRCSLTGPPKGKDQVENSSPLP